MTYIITVVVICMVGFNLAYTDSSDQKYYASFLSQQDRRTDPNSRVQPAIDAQQDWFLLAGSQAGGFTILEFSRLLDTGDTAGDRAIGEVFIIIFLYGMHC